MGLFKKNTFLGKLTSGKKVSVRDVIGTKKSRKSTVKRLVVDSNPVTLAVNGVKAATGDEKAKEAFQKGKNALMGKAALVSAVVGGSAAVSGASKLLSGAGGATKLTDMVNKVKESGSIDTSKVVETLKSAGTTPTTSAVDTVKTAIQGTLANLTGQVADDDGSNSLLDSLTNNFLGIGKSKEEKQADKAEKSAKKFFENFVPWLKQNWKYVLIPILGIVALIYWLKSRKPKRRRR